MLADGDSIFADGYFPSSPTRYASAFPGRVKFRKQAVSGSYIADVASRRAANLSYFSTEVIARQHSAKIWVCNIGINHMRSGNDVNTFLTAYAAECDAYRAAGIAVGSGNFAPRLGTTLTQPQTEAWLATANATIASWVGTGTGKHIDFLIDYAAHPIMGAPLSYTNTALFFDGLHPTELGEQYLYNDVFRQAVSAWTVPLAAPAQYSAWNPADKHADIVLSNANYAAANTAGVFRSVRGTAGRDSGKRQATMQIVGATNNLFGFGNLTDSLAGYLPTSIPGLTHGQNFGGIFNALGTIVNASGFTYVPGDWATWLIDFDLGEARIKKNALFSDGTSTLSNANLNVSFPPNYMVWLGFSPQDAGSSLVLPQNFGQLPYGLEPGYLAY